MTGFGDDDQIYWTFIQQVTTVHQPLSDTLSLLLTDTPLLTILTSNELSIIVGFLLYNFKADHSIEDTTVD
jgi:hypothetical protein